MSLASGRPYLAIPGPSVMPDRVLGAMHRAAPNIYAGALPEMLPGIVGDLKAVARTSGELAIYVANGHGAWEAALANTLGPGDRALFLATGRFGQGWAEMARARGIEAEVIDYGRRAPIDADRLCEVLTADRERSIKAVLAVHVDTSTSVRNDIAALRAALDAAGHPALLMVDCIASLACECFEMDAWGVDVTVSACQKGLMTPPGLGFVWFGARAAAARARLARVSQYWDWAPRANPPEFYRYFDGTAPTHHLFGLRAALDMIAEEGLDAVWARHAALARAIWAAFDAWGAGGPAALNIAEPAWRSHAVTAASIGAPAGSRLRDWVAERTGVTLGIGLGMAGPGDPAQHGFFRLGHMGHVNAHMVLGTLAAIDAGLKALEVPHGDGALDVAARVVAEA